MSNSECRMSDALLESSGTQPPCFSLAALIGDLRPHPELDLDTLAYHLTQSDATAAEGRFEAKKPPWRPIASSGDVCRLLGDQQSARLTASLIGVQERVGFRGENGPTKRINEDCRSVFASAF